MKQQLWQWVACVLLAAFSSAAPASEGDADGCKDHPLFNRVKGYVLTSCDVKDFSDYRFPTGAPRAGREGEEQLKLETVEGHYTELTYHLNEDQPRASSLQIMRNYQAAAKAAGGSVEGEWRHGDVDLSAYGGGTRATTLRIKKANSEAWVFVRSEEDGPYTVTLVEREAMRQDVVANELLDRINQDGYVALYINFDTGKATIKPDSLATVEEVVKMLKAAPDLKLEVGGHTDNVGKPEANQKLSEARAQSVMKALTERGIAVTRLTAKGYGDTRPTADNRNEEGRAKNRRVELTKR